MDKLKYSDLLLMGASQVKQCTGSYLECSTGDYQVSMACGVGMIAIAKSGTLNLSEVDDAIGDLMMDLQDIPNPTGVPGRDLHDAIIHMNDTKGWRPKLIAKHLKKHGY